ncbi:MAG: hypothetical protein HYU75_22105, partial [Betaproteobacteria bacterium]|nr:hypothetical protein [Betaproteobacteria bacterium]
MKAIVIREFGPPNVMRLEEVDDPTPGYEEVIVHLYLKQITVIGATGQMPADLVLSL